MVIELNKMVIKPSKIKGSVKISGSKNSSLPIIAASLVCAKTIKLKNIPNISDIKNLIYILEKIGCEIKFKRHTLKIISTPDKCELLFDEVKKFRASYYLMSVFIALFNEVKIYYPGGCSIGKRPIDFHIEGFKRAGCIVEYDEDIINIKANELKPFVYKIPKKSLGTTVNLLILASKIDGLSIIKNASSEPEIDDLINFINKSHSYIYRKEEDIYIIGNKSKISHISHKVIPDRIECFTYMCIGTFSKKLKIKNINQKHLFAPINYFLEAGAKIKLNKNSLTIKKSNLKKIDVTSGEYPLLSTDQMPFLYPLFSRVDGISTFTEGIFENRFSVCEQLKKTNANINVDRNRVFITGAKDIIGADLYASDLRCAAALLIEGMLNQNSTIHNLAYLERGYDDIYKKLKKIGLNFKLK